MTVQGKLAILLCLAVITMFIEEGTAIGSCPEVSKVYSCSPKCVENYECTHGKVCCPNSCHTKSCSEPAKNGASGTSGDKYNKGGAGQYCGNVKCSSFEVCKTDKSTSRPKCMRP